LFLPAKSLAHPFLAVAFADDGGLSQAGGWFALKEDVFLFNAEEASVVRKFLASFAASSAIIGFVDIKPGVIAFAQDKVVI
jgi:hypothetical protein